MQTLFMGFLDSQNKQYPFALTDMGVDVPDYNAGLVKLLELADSAIVSNINLGSSYSNPFFADINNKAVSLWQGFAGAANMTNVGLMNGGFYLSLDELLGLRRGMIDTSSGLPHGMPASTGALTYVLKFALALIPTTTSSFHPFKSTLADGSVLFYTENYAPRTKRSAVLMRNDGVCFCFDASDGFLHLGVLSASGNFVGFQHIGKLPSKKLYAIRAIHATASGTVYDAANQPSAGCRVLAYNRETGKLIGSAVSGADGRYVCHVSATKGSEIFMVCLDNAVAPDFEAQIIDRIVV